MDFNCSGCGACCKRIGLVQDKFKELNFPYQVNEKGWCEMLDENNKCKVYDNRPDICNIEKMSVKLKDVLKMTQREFYKKNTELCNSMINEDKLDKKYLMNETIYS